MTVRLPPETPLSEAQEYLRARANEGADCPCCQQRVRIYRRKLTSVAVRALTALYAECALGYGHLPTIAERRLPSVTHQGGYLNLAAHWGLMEAERRRRTDGGRTGYWRVTELGEEFLLGDASVPAYARVFDGRCLGLDGDPVWIEGVLGKGFDLRELLGGRGDATMPLFEEAA